MVEEMVAVTEMAGVTAGVMVAEEATGAVAARKPRERKPRERKPPRDLTMV